MTAGAFAIDPGRLDQLAGRVPGGGGYWDDWRLYVFILLIVGYAIYRVSRAEAPRQHENWVRLARQLDGRAEVSVRTRADMPLHEVQRIAGMLGYRHVSAESAPRGFTRHHVVRLPGLPDVPRTVPKDWWK